MVLLCADFQEAEAFRGCVLLAHFVGHFFVRQVDFVGQEHDDDALLGVVHYLLVPGLERVE